MEKQHLREEIGSLAAEDRATRSATIAQRLFSLPELKHVAQICCFVSLEDEPETGEIIQRLLSEGKQVSVPFFTGDGEEMALTRIDKETEWEPGPYGTRQPTTPIPIPKESIDLFLIPGVAFDDQGRRLGRGKGYYDRLLAKAPGYRMGLAFEERIVTEVPVEQHDISMDRVVTEQRFLKMEERMIDGKLLAAGIRSRVREQVAGVQPCLAIILVGKNLASRIYVRRKEGEAAAVGIETRKEELPESASKEEIHSLILSLNADKSVHGILLQLPLPKHLDEGELLRAISPQKDVDGIHPSNAAQLLTGGALFAPCTPKGIMRMLQEKSVNVAGAHAVVVGKSRIVGLPVAQLLLKEGATVTICHSRTEDLAQQTEAADILVVAVGKAGLIRGEMIKKGSVVIDVGMNRVEDRSKRGYHLVGDVNFDEAREKASLITPVPGGVGPMTVAMLMENMIVARDLAQRASERA